MKKKAQDPRSEAAIHRLIRGWDTRGCLAILYGAGGEIGKRTGSRPGPRIGGSSPPLPTFFNHETGGQVSEKITTFKVGTFRHERKSGSVYYMAYTRDYNPSWEGCREFAVQAVNGSEAKKRAIALRRQLEEIGK